MEDDYARNFIQDFVQDFSQEVPEVPAGTQEVPELPAGAQKAPLREEKPAGQNEFILNMIRAALKARETAYAPYSHYTVGAALLAAGGKIYTGGNIENASYGASNCAERTAIFKAVSEGKKNFLAIAIAGGMEGAEPVDYAYPCGICRQVMQEFAGRDFLVIVAKSTEDFRKLRLEDLLPYGFGGESIR